MVARQKYHSTLKTIAKESAEVKGYLGTMAQTLQGACSLLLYRLPNGRRRVFAGVFAESRVLKPKQEIQKVKLNQRISAPNAGQIWPQSQIPQLLCQIDTSGRLLRKGRQEHTRLGYLVILETLDNLPICVRRGRSMLQEMLTEGFKRTDPASGSWTLLLYFHVSWSNRLAVSSSSRGDC